MQLLSKENSINPDYFGFYMGDIDYVFEILSGDDYSYLGETKATLKDCMMPVSLTEYDFISILTCSLSGIYSTPYDYDNMKKTFYSITKTDTSNTFYYCEECKMKFSEIDTFLKHLQQTKHVDSFTQNFSFFDFYNK